MTANLQADLLVIGGGINGTSIALDAQGRGLNVILCEKDDLASGTSNWSSKLIHGGLRYLEQYDFKLVRHALQEREIWLERAPHLIKPLRFVLPHEKHLRPRWVLRIGLWLYDHLAKRKTIPSCSRINKASAPELKVLEDIDFAFSYYDCFCDDARLVVETAKSAHKLGASIFTRTKLTHMQAKDNQWLCTLEGDHAGTVNARMVVNAAGPWADIVSKSAINPDQHYNLQLVKGSHIVVNKLFDGDHAYILQNKDDRIVFAIPFQQHYTLIGTTDVKYQGDPDSVAIDDSEKRYLVDLINHYFKKQISLSDIVWEFSGVRPLFSEDSKNPSKMSRDYKCIIDNKDAPLLTVLGGKLTTARVLAEDAVNMMTPYFNKMGPSWTASKPLSGGLAINQATLDNYRFIPKTILQRMLKTYGSNITHVLANVTNLESLGTANQYGLFPCEIKYMQQSEWAKTENDLLWRRSKQGLHGVY